MIVRSQNSGNCAGFGGCCWWTGWPVFRVFNDRHSLLTLGLSQLPRLSCKNLIISVESAESFIRRNSPSHVNETAQDLLLP